jgi:hypothetical protein
MSDSPIDQLIDEVLGGDFDEEARAKVADEVAYQYFSKLREQAGGELDAETAQQINSLVPIPQEEKGECFVYSSRGVPKVQGQLLLHPALTAAALLAAANQQVFRSDTAVSSRRHRTFKSCAFVHEVYERHCWMQRLQTSPATAPRHCTSVAKVYSISGIHSSTARYPACTNSKLKLLCMRSFKCWQ